MTTRPLRHASHCTVRNVIVRTGAHGDPLEICRTCGRFGLAQTPQPAPIEPPQEVPTSRYRCGAHTDVPVTWKGAGCGRCKHDRDIRRRRKKKEADADAFVASTEGWLQ